MAYHIKSLDKFIKENIMNSWQYKLPNVDGFRTFQEYMDINKLTDDTLTEEAVDFYYKYNINSAFNRYAINYNSLLTENLKSHDADKLINKINKDFNDDIIEVKNVNNNTKSEHSIFVLFNLRTSNIITYDSMLKGRQTKYGFEYADTEISKQFQHIIDFFNYYPTYCYSENSGEFVVTYEPKTTENVFDDVIKHGGVVWHVTDRQNAKNILKRGLVPKTARYRYYPEKIFLIQNNKDKTKLKEQIENVISDKRLFPNNYCILKINLQRHNINIYVDTAYNDNNKLFTYESIPPQLITQIYDLDKI